MRWKAVAFVLLLLASGAVGQRDDDETETEHVERPESEESGADGRVVVRDSVCPQMPNDDDRVASCEEACATSSECAEGETCCFNGCGHECRLPVAFQGGFAKPRNCTKRCRPGASCMATLNCRNDDCKYRTVCVRPRVRNSSQRCRGTCERPRQCLFRCSGFPFKCSWNCVAVDLPSDQSGGFSNLIASWFGG